MSIILFFYVYKNYLNKNIVNTVLFDLHFIIQNTRDMLRKAVNEQVAAMMVLPNKFPVQLIQDVPLKSLKFSPPAVSTFWYIFIFL